MKNTNTNIAAVETAEKISNGGRVECSCCKCADGCGCGPSGCSCCKCVNCNCG